MSPTALSEAELLNSFNWHLCLTLDTAQTLLLQLLFVFRTVKMLARKIYETPGRVSFQMLIVIASV